MSTIEIILAINAGSSSLKSSIYSAEQSIDPNQIAEAEISGLTDQEARFRYSRSGKEIKDESVKQVSDQDAAFHLILKTLVEDEDLREIQSLDDITIVCHRVVHGGTYNDAKVITDDTYHHLQELSDLAPLHNGPALSIIQSSMRQLRFATTIACFDSQFHATIPPHISMYAINPEMAKNKGLRKYGFHGISYSFIARHSAEFLGKDISNLNIIALHLGSGASVCAIKNGESLDTSMGLTPLDGLPGATRSGEVDPSLIFHYTSDASRISSSSTKQVHISTAEEILNKKSGWKALTGTTDFAEIAESTEASHKLAFDMFTNRICGFIGSYYVALQGKVDALVFAGGIGERSTKLREAVAQGVESLGFHIDGARNESTLGRVVEDIGKPDSPHNILVCKTDEQYEMARICCYKQALWT